MGLPVVNTSTYTLTLPSTNKKVKYRPFYVKEEKILLMALEGLKNNNSQDMVDAIREIVDACTFNKLDPLELSITDIEYIFVHLRMKSKGEVINSKYKCKNKVNDKVCGASNDVSINLEAVEILKDKKHDKKVMLSKKVGVVMRYPTLNTLEGVDLDIIDSGNESPDESLRLMAGFIESVYTADEVFLTKDQSEEEVVEFLNNLTEKQIVKIKDFFDTMPKVVIKTPFKCKTCGYEHTIKLEGLQNFFG